MRCLFFEVKMGTKLTRTIGRFSTAIRGYDVNEVDDFLKNEENKKSRAILDLQSEIVELKKQNFELKNEIFGFQEKEARINEETTMAKAKAEQLTTDLKVQYALEIERLKLFQAKWTNAYEELKERYHFAKDALNMESVVTSTSIELEKALARDFSLSNTSTMNPIEQQFKSEVERLSANEGEMIDLFKQLQGEIRQSQVQKKEIQRKPLLEDESKKETACANSKVFD